MRARHRGLTERVSSQAMRFAARALVRGPLRLRVEGAEHVPTSGAAVIAARHCHHLYDGVALLAVCPRPIHVLTALDWVSTATGRRAMEGLAQLATWPVMLREEMLHPGPDGKRLQESSVYREDEVVSYRTRAIRGCVRLLEAGSLVVVFPEGYPNVDPHRTLKRGLDDFLPFQPGFARTAALAARRLGRPVPIVPAGFHFRPEPLGWSTTLRFGAPSHAPHPGGVAGLVEEVERRVVALSAGAPRGASSPRSGTE